MRTDKVIWRSILTTLLAIALLFGTLLFILCVIFPASMMEITYDLGMNKASVKYAERAYKRTDDVYYAAFATETSILLEDNAKIEENGLRLINDDTFLQYCTLRNEEIAKGNETAAENERVSITYEQYVYGQVTMAQYQQGKKADAIVTAFVSIEKGFPKNNAAALLYLTARKIEDEETATTINAKMQALRDTDLTDADRLYLEQILSA